MDSPMADDMGYKCADPELQLDVDTLTLDFLVHGAITAILIDRKNLQNGDLLAYESTDSAERAITSVDTCLQAFEENHPDEAVNPTVDFRLKLLKFTTLFCRRLIPTSTTPSPLSLAHLRETYRKRARKWHKLRNRHQSSTLPNTNSIQLPLSPDSLRRCRSNILSKFSLPSDFGSEFYGTDECVSLLDLLPSFMELTASRARLNADFNITERWMQLAGEFMLQAATESVLCFETANLEELLKEVFAWGFIPESEGGEEWEGEEVVNEMFRADSGDEDQNDASEGAQMQVDDREIQGWQDVRGGYLDLLQTVEDSQLATYLQTAAEFPISDFESKILSYLVALSQSIDAPVLVQLEQGRLTGLSIEETNDFKQRVGLGFWMA